MASANAASGCRWGVRECTSAQRTPCNGVEWRLRYSGHTCVSTSEGSECAAEQHSAKWTGPPCAGRPVGSAAGRIPTSLESMRGLIFKSSVALLSSEDISCCRMTIFRWSRSVCSDSIRVSRMAISSLPSARCFEDSSTAGTSGGMARGGGGGGR